MRFSLSFFSLGILEIHENQNLGKLGQALVGAETRPPAPLFSLEPSHSPGKMSSWTKGSSNLSYTSFVLLGFPGLQESRALLVLPFLSIYLVIVSANALVIHTVVAQRSLHQPMYLLIALLLAVNICAASTVVPAMLLSFSSRFSRISLARCLVLTHWKRF